jgi:DNA-binding CsgD family transcriptional regulator
MSPRSPHLRQRGLLALPSLALIELAYEAAAEPNLWPRWFDELASSLDHRASNIVVHGFGPTRYVSLDSSEPPFNTINSSRIFENKALSRQNFALAWVDDEIVEEWSRLGPEGWARSGIEVFTDETCSLRPADRRVLHSVLPHLYRALTLHFKLNAAKREHDTLGACLDEFSTGMLLLDRHATVLFANHAASDYLESRRGLVRCDGKLTVVESGRNASLHALMRTATSSRRRSLSCLKLGDGATLWLRGLGADRVAAYIAREQTGRALAPELLAGAFELTRAESRVGSLFASGLSVDEIAASLALSVHTVRLHIKSMQHKTGTHRQATLLRRMLETIPPVNP